MTVAIVTLVDTCVWRQIDHTRDVATLDANQVPRFINTAQEEPGRQGRWLGLRPPVSGKDWSCVKDLLDQPHPNNIWLALLLLSYTTPIADQTLPQMQRLG